MPEQWVNPKLLRLGGTGLSEGKSGGDPFEAVIHYCTAGTMYSQTRQFVRNQS